MDEGETLKCRNYKIYAERIFLQKKSFCQMYLGVLFLNLNILIRYMRLIFEMELFGIWNGSRFQNAFDFLLGKDVMNGFKVFACGFVLLWMR